MASGNLSKMEYHAESSEAGGHFEGGHGFEHHAILSCRQPVLTKLQTELPRLGFEPMTPVAARRPS